MARESPNLRPPFASWVLPHRMLRVLLREDFPIPPWYYRRSEHPMWSWECTTAYCHGAAHFGFTRCPRHFRLTDTNIIIIFARLAKVFIWASSLHLRGLLAELEDAERWPRLSYVSLAPLIIDMISRLDSVSEDLRQIRFGLVYPGAPKKSKENIEFLDAQVVAGERAVNFYLDLIRPNNDDFKNEYRLEQLMILIDWSCEYVERYVERRNYG